VKSNVKLALINWKCFTRKWKKNKKFNEKQFSWICVSCSYDFLLYCASWNIWDRTCVTKHGQIKL